MKVLITGAAGFLGCALARFLLDNEISLRGALAVRVRELTLLDLFPAPADILDDPRARSVVADLEDAGVDGDYDLIFHLAGVVSGGAESDFDLGMRVNIDGTRALLEQARRQEHPPVFVYTSSLAVFGSDGGGRYEGVVEDDTLPLPQSSYGVQKFIGEQLVAEYGRRGFVHARSVRLMPVTVRPGRANAAASSFISSIIREPAAGQRALCPVGPDSHLAVSSPSKSLAGILAAATAADEKWGSRTALTLPALRTTPREMLAALDRVTNTTSSSLVEWVPDPAVQSIVESWPSRFHTVRASGLGLESDASFEDIVREHVRSI